MEVQVHPVTLFAQNTTLIRCPVTGKAAFVDPGGEPQRLLEAARKADVELESILLTHGHVDHAGAAGFLAENLGLPVIGPQKEDLFWLESLPDQARMFGLQDGHPVEVDRWLEHGDSVRVGEQELEVLHCPGHTPGHVVFFHRASEQAWVGDVLFDGSIGRTDFPRGDYDTLIRSITERLLPLGDEVLFYPGHGPTSTLGEQRRRNPYLRGN